MIHNEDSELQNIKTIVGEFDFASELNNRRIAIISSLFNREISDLLLTSAHSHCLARGIQESNIQIERVPGAIEIPLVANLLAQQPDIAAIITLGAIIKGDTPHFDHVSKVYLEGCTRVMLTQNLPLIMSVLTTNTYQQALQRANGELVDTGQQSVNTAIYMIRSCQKLSSHTPVIGYRH